MYPNVAVSEYARNIPKYPGSVLTTPINTLLSFGVPRFLYLFALVVVTVFVFKSEDKKSTYIFPEEWYITHTHIQKKKKKKKKKKKRTLSIFFYLVIVVEFSDDESTWAEWTGGRIVTQPKEQSQTSTSRTNTWQEAISKCSVPNRNPSYTHYTKACVGGHNIVKFTGKTVEQCKEICSAMSNCVAFEFGVAYGGGGGYQPGDCQPQSSASRNCNGYWYNLDLYVKNQV